MKSEKNMQEICNELMKKFVSMDTNDFFEVVIQEHCKCPETEICQMCKGGCPCNDIMIHMDSELRTH
jgi:hypothetical protein